MNNQRGLLFLGIALMLLTISLVGTMAAMSIFPALESRNLAITYERGDLIRDALDKYQLDHGGAGGTFPTNLSDLVTDDGSGACAMDNNSANPTYLTLQNWCGPYLDVKTTNDTTEYQRDGWGNTFSYNNATGVIYSFGPDGVDDSGGNDDITFSP